MRTFYYDNYKAYNRQKSGRDLTDELILCSVREYGIENSHAYVLHDEHGKPYVEPRDELNVFVSVSHCNDTLVCLVAERNCGIDIQEPREINITKLAKRYYSEAEVLLVRGEGMAAFYKLWTRKEAYAKYTGKGLAEVMSGTQVIDRTDVEFQDTILDNGMYCSICVGKE